jgi:hypothetical protein
MPLHGRPNLCSTLDEGHSSHRASRVLGNSHAAYSLMWPSPVWCLGMTACLPCRSQVPSVQFNVMQDVAQFSVVLDGVPVYRHGGHPSSLMSWWMSLQFNVVVDMGHVTAHVCLQRASLLVMPCIT